MRFICSVSYYLDVGVQVNGLEAGDWCPPACWKVDIVLIGELQLKLLIKELVPSHCLLLCGKQRHHVSERSIAKHWNALKFSTLQKV